MTDAGQVEKPDIHIAAQDRERTRCGELILCGPIGGTRSVRCFEWYPEESNFATCPRCLATLPPRVS